MIAISIFMAIQALKLYDLLFGDSHSFTIKYVFIDSVYLWILPVFRIPWLTFNFPVVMVQILVMTIFNALLGNNALSLTAVLGAIWKGFFDREVSLSGGRVRSRDFFDPTQHLHGKYTVHILPESTALLDPVGGSYCIGSASSSLNIPVRLNATEPIFIQLTHVDFDTLQETSFNFSKKDIRRHRIDVPPENLEGSKLSYVGLPVEKPGLYKLSRVIDSSNLDVRIYQKHVLVTTCPSAYILGASGDDSYTDRCIGTTDTPKLVVDGVAPLKVKYSRSIKGRETLFSVQSVQPEKFESPLLRGRLTETGYTWSHGEPLQWASSQTVEVDMDTTLGISGEWLYNIDEVEDAMGNIVNYAKIKQDLPLMMSRSLSYGFMVHSRPTVRFLGCDSENAVKVPKGHSANLPLELSGDASSAPYIVEFERQPLDEDDSTKPETFTLTMKNSHERLSIDKPGVYTIRSLKGKHCQGDVLESSSCLVYVPPEPAIQAEFVEITDKCAGSVGITADLSLTGTGPFRVAYRVIRDGVVTQNKYIDIAQSRYQLEIRPESAGNYVYEFYSLDDSVYKGQRLEGLVAQQTIRALAGASFVQKAPRIKSCSGDSVKVDAKLHGIAPYKLTYEIVQGGNKRSQYTDKDIKDSVHTITTSALKSGGRYTISLISVEDGNGCKTMLNEPDAVIEVRRQRPAAGFLPIDGTMNIKALEGRTVGLPLRLSGEGPWNVVYRYENPDTHETMDRQIKVSNANGEVIPVNERGRYSLVSVQDVFCPGELTDNDVFDISWHSKPDISVVPTPALTRLDEKLYSRKDICEGDEDVFEIGLGGAPPFSIGYTVAGPMGHKDQKIQVATKYANVRLWSSKPGTYTYTFNDVSDSIYEDQPQRIEPIKVQQRVHARPLSGFANRGRTYKSCITDIEKGSSGQSTIGVKLQGQAPFSLTVSVRHEGTGKIDKVTIPNIEEKAYELPIGLLKLGLGRHSVSLEKLSDANGCSRELFNEDEKVYVAVSDVPRLSPINPKSDYCVGDRIGFSLTGMAPFEVVYEFNGKRQKASTNSPFSRLASVPGNLTLVALTDSASACAQELHDSMTIHDLPSVSVVDGTSIIRDIHEGDQTELIFKFSGTPPFSFTYTRSEPVGRPARYKVVETQSVANVDGYEYSILTSKQGTYEVISLKDAHCSVATVK